MAKMQDIFHGTNIKFQPRITFSEGRDWAEERKKTKCTFGGKYCFDFDDHMSLQVQAIQKIIYGDEDSPSLFSSSKTFDDRIIEPIREMCVFESLGGMKSHWLRFMDAMSKGCGLKKKAVLKNATDDSPYKTISTSCFERAVKIANVYTNFNREKYDACVASQKKDVIDNQDNDYDDSKSKNFFDRDWKARRDAGNIVYTPSLSVNGEVLDGKLIQDAKGLFSFICSKLTEKPEECKDFGTINQKQEILDEYVEQYGEEKSPERVAITMEYVKEKHEQNQAELDHLDRTSTKTDLVIILLVFFCATGAVLLCRHFTSKNEEKQQVHDAVNAQVSNYFQLTQQNRTNSDS